MMPHRVMQALLILLSLPPASTGAQSQAGSATVLAGTASPAQEIENALHELNTEANRIDKTILNNAGVRYFIANPAHLELDRFEALMEGLSLVGQARLLYLAVRSQPGRIGPSRVTSFTGKRESAEIRCLGYAAATRLIEFNYSYYYDEGKKRYVPHPGYAFAESGAKTGSFGLDPKNVRRLHEFLDAVDVQLSLSERRARANHVLEWLRSLPNSRFLTTLTLREGEVAADLAEGALSAFARKKFDLEKTARVMLGSGRKPDALTFARGWIEEASRTNMVCMGVFCQLMDRYGESSDVALLRAVETRVSDPAKKWSLRFFAERLARRTQ